MIAKITRLLETVSKTTPLGIATLSLVALILALIVALSK